MNNIYDIVQAILVGFFVAKFLANTGRALKGHGQLCGRADLDPSFLHFEKSPPQSEIKNTLRVHLKTRFNLPSVLLDFPSFTENLFLSVLLVILCYYFIIFG